MTTMNPADTAANEQQESGSNATANTIRLGASANHERRKLDAVREAAGDLERAVAAERRARELRDLAVRAAIKAGVPSVQIAEAAGVSAGRITHIATAPPTRQE